MGIAKRYCEISAFILAGGVSSRMGREKGLLEFGGEPLIVRTARLIEPLVTEVTVVGSPEQYASQGLRVIADQNLRGQDAVRAPLVGIATALNVTKSAWNLILACDLPYLTAEWLDWLLALALESQGEVVVPQTARGLEPLAAVYRRECATPIANALGRGVRRITDALAQLRVDVIPTRQWKAHDPEGLVLRNMNTPQDYEQAQNWWEAKAAETHGASRKSGTK